MAEGEKKKRKVYSTAVIEELVREKNEQGFEIPYDAFYERDLELRAPGITFSMTPQELEEYQKCYDDPIYFVENYCKFQNDAGRTLVKLRDFQRNIINLVTEERWNDSLNDTVPANRNVIIMASRQIGKCCGSSTYVNSLKGKLQIGEIYQSGSNTISVPKRIVQFLYSHSNFSFRLKCFLGRVNEKIETAENKNAKVFGGKFIGRRSIDENILSDGGYVHASQIYKTMPFPVYEVKFKDGGQIECADNHIFFTADLQEIFAKDLYTGLALAGKESVRIVKEVIKYPFKQCMYDITIDSDEHRYYTNGVLSHNTTTVASMFVHKLIFHQDYNALIAANKEDTAKEIVDKVLQIFKGLPFFLKPGIINWGKTGITLDNGSKLLSTPTTMSASIGYTVHCLYLDEFAHIAENIVNNFWRSIYPTLSSSLVSQCIITSTPNGTTNKFYELWTKSIAGENSFKNIRVDYWQVPGHDTEEWVNQMKADFGDEEFAQEFELQFNINSKMLLKAKDLEFMQRIQKQYVPKQLYTKNTLLNEDTHLTWHPDFDPTDIKKEDRFVILVDIAEWIDEEESEKKKKKADSNTLNIFKVVYNSYANMAKYAQKSCKTQDAFRFVQVGKYTCKSEDEVYMAYICSGLVYDLFQEHEYENVRVMVEMNFNGKSFTTAYQLHPNYTESSLQRTYHTKPVPGEKQRRRLGFKTTTTKEFYCNKGSKEVAKKRIIVNDIETITQLKSFGFIKGKLGGIGMHDDLSMPSLNHIPRMIDDNTFIEWLDEHLENCPEELKYKLNFLLEKWDMDNAEISDEEFNSMYQTGGENEFRQLQPSGYGGAY